MDYLAGQSSATHFEYVVDRRESVHQIKQNAFSYMEPLEGWCSPQKADFLMDLVLLSKPKKIVEIGVWGGKSLVPMAYILKMNESGRIYGIDPWDSFASVQWLKDEGSRDFWWKADHGLIYRGLVDKIQTFGLMDQIELITATSEGAPSISEIDLLHIDGNHSEETSFYDVTKWVPLVKKGGYILFDDMTWFEEGVYTTAKAVKWLDEHCFKLAEFSDVCVWGIWIKL